MRIPMLVVIAVCISLVDARPAAASFHLMQIEQVIGGVNGDVTQQAIQLRMRAAGQNLVSQARIRAWDATGANPVLIVDTTSILANGAAGARVLIISPQFQACYNPPSDFIMANGIPASYLAAGSLTYEGDDGAVWWRLSWGGASYTGSGAGVAGSTPLGNDLDGNFNPPFAGPLPTASVIALRFPGAASALSTNNAADYALTPGAAVFTVNSGQSFTMGGSCPCCVPNGNCVFVAHLAQCSAVGGTISYSCPVTGCTQPCPADIAPAITGDDAVNVSDLLAVINGWGACSAPCPPSPPACADIDNNCQVNVTDLLAVINAWGPCP